MIFYSFLKKADRIETGTSNKNVLESLNLKLYTTRIEPTTERPKGHPNYQLKKRYHNHSEEKPVSSIQNRKDRL